MKLEPGYYRLKEDVKNPHPDRRSRRVWAHQEVWTAGTLLRVKDTNVASSSGALLREIEPAGRSRYRDRFPLGFVKPADPEYFQPWGNAKEDPEARQALALAAAMERVETPLYHQIEDALYSAQVTDMEVLMDLVGQGILSVEAIAATAKDLSERQEARARAAGEEEPA